MRRRILVAYLILTARSEEHTSELQSHLNLVCRLLLEKKKLGQGGNSCKGARERPVDAVRVDLGGNRLAHHLGFAQDFLRCGCGKFAYPFFFNDTPPPDIYTLSLHDALPI